MKKATYIIKYYNNDDNNDNNMDSIFDLKHQFIQSSNNKSNYNLIIQNENNKKFINFNDNYNCTYFLKLFKEKEKLNDELLNTIAPINSEAFLFNQTHIKDPSKEIIYYLENLNYHEKYLAKVLIKIENSYEEKYYSYIFNLDTIKNNDSYDKNNTLIIVIVGISVGFIILSLILFILLRTVRRKNQKLEEKVEAISFSSGIDEDSIENENNKKKDEDYETTFI